MGSPILLVLPPKTGGSYERDLKFLRKTFPGVDRDANAELARLATLQDRAPYEPPNVVLVPGFGRELLKVRIASSDQGRGKSGGFRMLLLRTASGGWRPVAIYAKGQSENLETHAIKSRLKEDDKAEQTEAEAEPSPQAPDEGLLTKAEDNDPPTEG